MHLETKCYCEPPETFQVPHELSTTRPINVLHV